MIFVSIMILFLITSSIHVGETPSAFTSEERLHQTVLTIKSIKSRAEKSLIYLFESSNISDAEFEALRNAGAEVVRLNSNRAIRDRCGDRNQSVGEMAIMYWALKMILMENREEFEGVDYIVKVSGRYYLDNDFSLEKVVGGDFYVFREFCEGERRWFSTMIYSVPRRCFYEFYKIIQDGLSADIVNIETYLRGRIRDDEVNVVDVVGGSGWIGHSRQFVCH